MHPNRCDSSPVSARPNIWYAQLSLAPPSDASSEVDHGRCDALVQSHRRAPVGNLQTVVSAFKFEDLPGAAKSFLPQNVPGSPDDHIVSRNSRIRSAGASLWSGIGYKPAALRTGVSQTAG
jgi:hypothetical protein